MSRSPYGEQAPRRRRTKWDARAETAREELLEQGIERIVECGIEAITSLVNPSALARASGTVSVDTAYRLLGSSEAAMGMIVDRVTDPGWRAKSIGWPSEDDVTTGAVTAFGSGPSADAALHAFTHFLRSNFELPAKPLGLILDGVAATASPAWRGGMQVSESARALAEQVIERRRASLEHQRDAFRWMVQDALAALHRRPRPGVTLDLMVSLMHALADGSVNRMLMWPESLTVEEVAMAVLELGLALSEDGSLIDPRCPDDAAAREVFTRVVEAADDAWRDGLAPDDIDALGARCGVHPETISVIFGSPTALADSVLRRRVVVPVLDDVPALPSVAVFAAALSRLAEAADAMPGAVGAAARLSGDGSLVEELRRTAALLAEGAPYVTVPADRFAAQVVDAAMRGAAMWTTTELLLDLLRAQDERTDEVR